MFGPGDDLDVGSRGGAEAGSWVLAWVTEGLEQLDHGGPLAVGWGGAGFCWEWEGGVMGSGWHTWNLKGQFLLRPLFFVCRRPPSCHVLRGICLPCKPIPGSLPVIKVPGLLD